MTDLVPIVRPWLSMKNFLAAFAFVLTGLVAGNSIAVLANDSESITESIAHSLSGSMMEYFTGEEEMVPVADNTILGEPDPNVPKHAKTIRISLRNQMAFLLEYGKVVKSYRISSGAWATPTPRGSFKVYKKQPLRVSSQGVPYRMPNYMAFTPNEAFGMHALPYLGRSPESSWYWQEAVTHIGIPVSHGCIRFLPEEAVEVYEWADVGTKVFIRG